MAAHTAHAKHSLGLDNMLGEKKVELIRGERNQDLREAALAEVQTWGLNPHDDQEELMEFIELQRLLHDTEADCVTETGWLAILVRDVSKVLLDRGMPPISGIPRDLCMAGDLLGGGGRRPGASTGGYASGNNPWE
jgi:hypothetical protein